MGFVQDSKVLSESYSTGDHNDLFHVCLKLQLEQSTAKEGIASTEKLYGSVLINILRALLLFFNLDEHVYRLSNSNIACNKTKSTAGSEISSTTDIFFVNHY